MSSLSIERLPHPIIEYIFSYLSPYRDLKHCLLVNKTWYDLVHETIRKIRRDFHNAVTARKVCWEHSHAENCPTISRRYSHSSCICGDSMFVFGGCTTACTTFNDLWRLDLGIRSWIRPLATGTYPPPKACASMVCYRENLILFGGWTHTSPYPLHQAWHIFNHIHIYNTNTNRWNQVVSSTSCPGMAGHTASMVGECMVVFGGLHCQSGWGPFTSSNEIWVLDVKTMTWRKQRTTSPSPHPRYGHSQINIDSNHLLIIGGCGGPNMLFSDIWLLKISDEPEAIWEWKEVEILQKDNAAPQLTFHPACRVDSKVVVLSKAQWSRTLPSCLPQLLRAPTRTWVPPRAEVFARPEPKLSSRPPEKELNVNGRKGVLKRHLQRNLARRNSNNTSSSDDEDVHAASFSSKKGIIVSGTSPTLLLDSEMAQLCSSSSTATNSEPNLAAFSSQMDIPPLTFKNDEIGPILEIDTPVVLTLNEPLKSSLPNPNDGILGAFPGDFLSPEIHLETLPCTSLTSSILSDEVANSSPDNLSDKNSSSDVNKPSSASASGINSNSNSNNSASRQVLSVRPNSRRNRQRQLEGLDRMEQRIRNLRSGAVGRNIPISKPASWGNRPTASSISPKNPMCLYVLDINEVVDNCRVTWVQPQATSTSGLEEIILYSLVLGRGELVMFGGIQKDMNSNAGEGEKAPQTVSNSLHFISAFKYVI